VRIFDNEERVKRLEDTCRGLVGKRFSEHYQCRHFVVEALEGAGVEVPGIEPVPQTSPRHGRFHNESVLIEWLQTHPEIRGHLIVVDPDDPWMAGDLIVLREGGAAHHLGIRGKERVYHLPAWGSVVEKSEEWARRMVSAVFRIKGVESEC